MNESQHKYNDRALQRMLADAVGPAAISDQEIERLSAASRVQGSADQLARILTRTQSLLKQQPAGPTAARLQASSLRQEVASSTETLKSHMTLDREVVMKRVSNPSRGKGNPKGAIAALTVAALSLIAVLLVTSEESIKQQAELTVQRQQRQQQLEDIHHEWMTARQVPATALQRIQVGDTIRTSATERRRVGLPDGSVLFVNANTEVHVATSRQVRVNRGEVFVEVVPQFDQDDQKERFEVVTPHRTVTALGTKFAVDASAADTDVLVTQGAVKVSGVDQTVAAGQILTAGKDGLSERQVTAAGRASEALQWTRELIAAAGAIVPASSYSGGAIITVDPSGQEMQLSLRKYHVDVHIEDGFARTTIDQTYFNHTSQRLEGTFHFPLPPDASLSRLAMYVNGRLMEGGMAERQHARNTFEQIVTKMKDPALLEWVDGSTFKMRVFPLEPRQEKRIVLSYTQRLNSAYGRTYYRFPAGHNMDTVKDWSTNIRVDQGAQQKWNSPSHRLAATVEDDDLVLQASDSNSPMDRDLVLEVANKEDSNGKALWSGAIHEGQRYLMLRLQPDLPAKSQRPPRHWTILFEASAARDPLLARTQIEIIRALLDNAEHSDTFSLITANTKPTVFRDQPIRCSAKNVAQAITFLEQAHLIGALDLQKALAECRQSVAASRQSTAEEHAATEQQSEQMLVHVGTALPVLGENRQSELLEMLPKNTAYVGVGVGRRWAQSFMRQAAGKTGGYFTQINPDEEVAWRAFELSSVLNTPRLLDVAVEADGMAFLNFADTVVHGEQICAVGRIAEGEKVPRSVVIRGTVDGKPWQKTVRVRRVADQAEYLPRTWAKLEIDRLVGEDAQKHRDQIISLSKAMYVMSPFTSLLVLENEEMYTQYNIDRGRKDHWALYPCPDEIKVVTEPLQPGAEDVAQTKKSTVQQLAESVKVLPEPQVVSWPNVIVVLPDGGYVYSSSSAGFQQPPHVYFGDVIRSANYGGDPGRNMDGLDARLFYSYQDTSSPMATLDLLSESEAKLTNRFLGEQGNSIDAIWLDLGMRRLQERYSKLPVLVPVEGRVPSDFAIVNAQTADGFIQLQRFDASDFYFYDQAQRFGVASAGTPSVSFVLPSPNEMLARHFWGEPSLVPNSGRMNNAWMFSAPGLQSRSELLRRRAGLRQQANLGIPQTDDLYSIVQLQDLTVDMLQTMPAQRFTVRAGQEDFGLPLVIAENVSGLEFDQPLTMTVQPWDGGTWGRNFNSAFGFEELNRNLGRRSVRLVPGSELMPLQGLANGVPEGWASLDLPFRNYSTSGRGTELSGIVPFGRSSVVEPRSAVHRWATAPQQNRRPFVSLPTFSPAVTPEFGNDRRLFGDLMSHAPGLNTSRADMLHVMTSELTNDVARAESAQANADTATGTVDPAARRLINKARAASWESVRLPGQSEDSELVIQCDGQGRYVWTRIVSEGLQERVVCDGETLLHLYDEIGLGARRTYSRFHHSTIHQLVPWLLPDIDLLARQYHITAVNDHTVALTPIVDARSQSADDTEPAEESEDDKDGKADSRRWILHLVFDQQGHLAARRLVDQESGEVLRTVEFSLDGTVRLIDAEGEVAATANWRRSPCDAADLNPDTSNLVVLPLPYRSEEAGPVVAAKSVADADLSEEDALRLMASHLASGNADAMIRIIRSRFFAKDDRRDGFYVLLSRFPEKLVWEEDVDGSDGRRQSVDLRPSAEGSPLRQFVRQWINWQLQNSDTTEFAIEGPADGFVQRLATARNLYLRWKLQTATTDRTTSQVKAELDQVLEFVDSCRTDVMGWTLLSVVEKALPHDRFGEDFAATAQRFENNPALAMWARQERVRTLFRAGRHRKARNLYRELLTNLLQSGSMPRIDAEIRTLYREHNGEPSWNKLVADIGGRILESGLPRTALMFSIQLRSLGDSEAAGWLLQQVLDSIDPAERPDVALLAIEQLRALQNNQSWDLMAAVVQVQELSEWSDLWHYAATVADEAGRKRRALDHLEHAVQLDFRNRPDVINLQSLRADYSSLLQRFEELVDASATLELPPPEELMARIIRAADQWRSIDDDDTQCCQMAARILTKLNRRDLAWAYITTPLAESSGESTQWISLAESLSGQNQWELADVAWQRAFEFEQTNPDILLRHAELLQANGQIRRSRQLLQRIIQGSWQSRFSGTVNKARQLLN